MCEFLKEVPIPQLLEQALKSQLEPRQQSLEIMTQKTRSAMRCLESSTIFQLVENLCHDLL